MSGVVIGTISLCDHVAYALFDPGVTHLFISEQFVRLVGIEPVLLETILYVSTPMNDRVLVPFGCHSCKIFLSSSMFLLRCLLLDSSNVTCMDSSTTKVYLLKIL